jgi:site-specific DNA-methyltransferase (adenine-specific)
MLDVLTVNELSVVTSSQLYQGDCLAVVPTLPDNSVDCILTDPPYGYNYRSRSHKLPLTKIANDRHEAIPLLRQALRLAYSKLKENGVGLIFTNWQCYCSMAAVIEEEGYEIKNLLIWEKNAWSRGDLKGNWGYSYEMVMYFKKRATPSKLRRFLRGKREGNILKFKKLPTNAMQHPTEKPVELLKYLIEKTTTAPGEVVLDMFMGSGSTCVAAKQTNRQYIGIEMEPVWFEVAQARLAA